MTRTLTAAITTAIQSQRSEILHLLELQFAGGTIRFTSGPNDVSWNSQTWYASGSNISYRAVTESADIANQRLQLVLDGVNLQVITSLLGDNSVGRLATLYRAHLATAGTIIADPFVLFTGYMMGPWDVTENPDNRSCSIETEIISPLAVLGQIRGIRADLNSHQAIYPGDTFFDHITTKPQVVFGWGPGDLVPVKS